MNVTEPVRSPTSLPEATGMLLVISGPAGVGKDTVWRAASPCLPTFKKAVTCTTRARRPGEVEGVHYYYVDDAEFDRMIHDDELLEWAHVHNSRYGIPTRSVLERITSGEDVVCVIDVQGAMTIRNLFASRALLVFLTPPTGSPNHEADILKQRIEGRGPVDEAELNRRLQRAAWEMTHIPLYDYQIVNEEVAHAARQLCEIVQRERAKKKPVQGKPAAGKSSRGS